MKPSGTGTQPRSMPPTDKSNVLKLVWAF